MNEKSEKYIAIECVSRLVCRTRSVCCKFIGVHAPVWKERNLASSILLMHIQEIGVRAPARPWITAVCTV